MKGPLPGRRDASLRVSRTWVFGSLAVAIACSGCPREPAAPRAAPLAGAEVVRIVGDSADVVTWTARRDEARRALNGDGASAPLALLHAAAASRNVALALGDARGRAAELEQASKWAREAVARAPGDPDAGYLLARLLLDRIRAATAPPETLHEARGLLVTVVSQDPTYGRGAALSALGEVYALAGAGRDDGLELERAAGYFEGALDVNRDYLPAHLGYAELVLVPWKDPASATEHLRGCRDARLDPRSSTFVDDDRAQRRCGRSLPSTAPESPVGNEVPRAPAG